MDETDLPDELRGAAEILSSAIGSRVRRNPEDWEYDDQDGGDGALGTIVDIRMDGGAWAGVRWDNGYEDGYRFGADGKWDLIIVEPPSADGGAAGAADAAGAEPAAAEEDLGPTVAELFERDFADVWEAYPMLREHGVYSVIETDWDHPTDLLVDTMESLREMGAFKPRKTGRRRVVRATKRGGNAAPVELDDFMKMATKLAEKHADPQDSPTKSPMHGCGKGVKSSEPGKDRASPRGSVSPHRSPALSPAAKGSGSPKGSPSASPKGSPKGKGKGKSAPPPPAAHKFPPGEVGDWLAQLKDECDDPTSILGSKPRECDGRYELALSTLLVYANNVVQSPAEPKVRRVNCSNRAFARRIGVYAAGWELMNMLGFKPVAGEHYLHLPPGASINAQLIDVLQAELDSWKQ